MNTKPPNKTQIIYPSNILYSLHNGRKVPDGMVAVVLNRNLQGKQRYSTENVEFVKIRPVYD